MFFITKPIKLISIKCNIALYMFDFLFYTISSATAKSRKQEGHLASQGHTKFWLLLQRLDRIDVVENLNIIVSIFWWFLACDGFEGQVVAKSEVWLCLLENLRKADSLTRYFCGLFSRCCQLLFSNEIQTAGQFCRPANP